MVLESDRSSFWEWIWHGFVLGMILVVPARIAEVAPFWSLSRQNAAIVVAFAAIYFGSLCVALLADRVLGYPRSTTLVATGGGGTVLLYMALLLAPVQVYSRLLMTGSILVALGIFLPWVVSLRHRVVFASLGLVGLAATVGVGNTVLADAILNRTEVIRASRHTLSATYYSGFLPAQAAEPESGGAIAPVPDSEDYLLVRASGSLYRFAFDPAGRLRVEPLGIRVPVNRREFASEVNDTAFVRGFRVADMLVEREGQRNVVYVSHHYWRSDDRCFVVRVSSHDLGRPAEPWRTLFESAPCLRIQPGRGAFFAGEQAGGNLESLGPGQILLTVGDHQFDGFYKDTNLVEDLTADYGKTVAIDTRTGNARFFTFGHRNPQGLTMDSQGRLWSTEHGPQGGDELNLLVEGQDYGYPHRTYGTDYGSVLWPPAMNEEAGKDYADPSFAWVPSVGISDLISISDAAFHRWKGDLLIASLAGTALWRVHLEGDRVVYTEPIEIGERVRDITTRNTGDVVLWTDSDKIVRIQPRDSIDGGSALFTVHCGGCHDDEHHRRGPNLKGLFGRPVASAAGYDYSTALGHVNGYWTEERLDEFLTDPRSMVPGTKKVFRGIPDAGARGRIIEYLRDFY